VARGEIAEPWNEFAKRAVKLGVIVALIQNTGFYQEYVIEFLAGSLPDALSNALSSKPIPDASAFDSLAKQIAILLTQVWQGTGWSAPAAAARAAVVTLLVMPLLWGALIVGFVVTLWAKAGMYFVAAVGPLFIALAMFDQTRKYLHNWLDQIVSMIALQILVALTCGLVIQGLEKATKSTPTPDTVFALAGHVIVLAVFSLAIWSSLPRLASKLGGYGASLAGAGSRAAPLETLRAPLSSFNEHGSPPPGRPELATIAARGGDRHSVAPIVPSPVVSGDGGGGPASASFGSAAPVPTRATDTAACPQGGPQPELFDGGHGVRTSEPTAPDAPSASAASAVAQTAGGTVAGTSVRGPDTLEGSRLDLPAGTSPTAGEPTRAPTSRPDTAFEIIVADQRTGFESMDFESLAPRATDTGRIATAALGPAIAGQPDALAAEADTSPSSIAATNRRPS
jgi:type IV secretion system protein VirB6